MTMSNFVRLRRARELARKGFALCGSFKRDTTITGIALLVEADNTYAEIGDKEGSIEVLKVKFALAFYLARTKFNLSLSRKYAREAMQLARQLKEPRIFTKSRMLALLGRPATLFMEPWPESD